MRPLNKLISMTRERFNNKRTLFRKIKGRNIIFIIAQ